MSLANLGWLFAGVSIGFLISCIFLSNGPRDEPRDYRREP